MPISSPTHGAKIKLAERIRIYEQMSKIISKDKDGYAIYAADWDDNRVARLFKCNVSMIVNLRKELFGKLRPPKNEHFVKYTDLVARVKQLEEAVTKLEDSVGNLIGAKVFGGNLISHTNGHSNHPTVGA